MHEPVGELPPEPKVPPFGPSIPNWPSVPVPGRGPEPAAHRLPLLVEALPASLDEALLLRRIVTMTGDLDGQRATEVAARLLQLDAIADGDITLRLDCGAADVGAALMLVDTFGSLRANVHVLVVGQAIGAAVVVLAAADTASMYPHARIVLTEPDVARMEGDAAHLDAQLAEQQRVLGAAYDVIARRCRRSRDEIEADTRRHRLLTAADAVDYGIVDRVE